jgi:hypothetical protein
LRLGAVMSLLLALRWHNLPCALKAAIGNGKRTSGNPRQSAAPQGPQQGPRLGAVRRLAPVYSITRVSAQQTTRPSDPASGVADSLDESKTAFRAKWDAQG